VPSYVLLAAESALSVFGVRSVYEQPRYEVLARISGGIEIRRYAPRLAAEATVEAGSEEAGRNDAFRILAGYIFGKNRQRSEVAITSPVATAPDSREIAMTSPVATAGAGPGRWTQRFFLPTSLTAETAPTPTDPRIRIVELPEEASAAITFTGLAPKPALDAQKRILLGALAGSIWRPAGEPYTLFYDPPFTIPPLRRNEIAVAVAPAG
jgi:hypothetical protein